MRKLICLFLLQFLFISCGSDDDDSSGDTELQPEVDTELEILTDQNDTIWGFDFLNQNEVIFSERAGSMGILNLQTRSVEEITNVPDVAEGGEGGLLDLNRISLRIVSFIFVIQMARVVHVHNLLGTLNFREQLSSTFSEYLTPVHPMVPPFILDAEFNFRATIYFFRLVNSRVNHALRILILSTGKF